MSTFRGSLRYKSNSYHNYLPFVGDVRKLKRLINTVVLFELESTDFKNSDFNKSDLIHLLLIYIHYPNVFRKIYDAETQGGRGFFSAVAPYDDGYPAKQSHGGSDDTYENSTYYSEYLEQFPPNSRQRFLLEKVFNVKKRLENQRIEGVPDIVRTSYACFNGGWTNGRNLESYLNLIVNLSKPLEIDQHKFYENWKDEILSGNRTIEQSFSDPNFSLVNGESTNEKLWRIIINNARNFPKPIAEELIKYLVNSLPKYSHLEIDNISIGLRKDFAYFLTRLLNDAGWADDSGKHSGNTEENIKEIAEWIFGEGRHVDFNLLGKLSNPERGILGIYDLMIFRLYCSADRGGDIFNLTRALSKHGSVDAPTEGNVSIIAREEMREISQEIFKIYKKQYIDKNINIFKEIEDLGLEDLAGEIKDYLQGKVLDGTITQQDLDKQVAIKKSIVTVFIAYQLGNDLISHGVGCGYYDSEGVEDKHEIKKIINDYLFNTCFNPAISKENAEYFADYLLRNFANVFASEHDRNYIPHINEFTKVLDKEKLANFWKKHSSTIKGLNLESKEKTLYVGNYTATYKEDILVVFKVLDEYLQELNRASAAEQES